MHLLRRLHLYLGCFFAPMLLFFSVSGIWQVYGLQRGDKPSLLTYLSTIHTGHVMRPGAKPPPYTLSSAPLQFFVAVMGAGLLVSIVTGVILAFRYGRGYTLLSLAAGIFVPILVIMCFVHRT